MAKAWVLVVGSVRSEIQECSEIIQFFFCASFDFFGTKSMINWLLLITVDMNKIIEQALAEPTP